MKLQGECFAVQQRNEHENGSVVHTMVPTLNVVVGSYRRPKNGPRRHALGGQ